MENLKLSKHVNWRQRFVVVSDGCCYCFEDEVAKEPLQKFSLHGYNRVTRTASDRNQFCFMLEPQEDQRIKRHYFACSSDDDRKLWMQAFKGGMMEANSSHLNSGSHNTSDDDVFKELEKPLFEDAVPRRAANEDAYSSDSGSSESDYDRLDEEEEPAKPTLPPSRRCVPLPPLPGEANKAQPAAAKPTAPPRQVKNKPLDPRKRDSAAAAKAKPTVAEKPPRRLSEKDCLFDNSDREQAISILREKKVPGTFLIRKSRQGDSKVLAVMTTEDVKEYKIFTEGGQVSLDRKTFFSNVDDLLENYSRAPLPNRAQTLGRAYSSHHVGGH